MAISISSIAHTVHARPSWRLLQVEQLRRVIQRLCESANPLAKCVDLIGDDTEQMDQEIERWKKQYAIQVDQLRECERCVNSSCVYVPYACVCL